MFEALLVTTSSEGLQPLGSAAQRSYELVTSTLKTRLSPAHANLFGEPVATQHGDMIDWYAPMKGEAVPLPDLSEAEQSAVRDNLGRLIGDIRGEAEKLAQSEQAEDQRLSEALVNAIEVPDETMVRVVRGADGVLHPVLVHWAWVRDEQASVRGVLTGMVPRPKPPQPAVTLGSGPVAGASPVWWWLILLGWLLLATLLGIILYLLIAPCGVNQGRLVFCPPDAPMASGVAVERVVIEDEIAILEHELALKNRVCKPIIPVQPATPVPAEATPEPATPDKPDPPVAPAEQPAPNKAEADPAEATRRITERGAELRALNFVLEWHTRDDIDLSVTCPAGATISYLNRGDCNADFDLDANVVRATSVDDPVENIGFEEVVPGIYKVRANLKSNRTDGDKTVTLHVLRSDGRSQSYTGTLGAGKSVWTINISISG